MAIAPQVTAAPVVTAEALVTAVPVVTALVLSVVPLPWRERPEPLLLKKEARTNVNA